MNWVIENVRGAGGYLLGRGTCQIFAAHWPDAPAERQVLAEPLNALPKYVASTTLDEPLGWHDSRLLRGGIGAAVRALKAEDGKDLHVIGSPGTRPDPARPRPDRRDAPHDRPHRARRRQAPVSADGSPRRLRLRGSQVPTAGAILATYIRA